MATRRNRPTPRGKNSETEQSATPFNAQSSEIAPDAQTSDNRGEAATVPGRFASDVMGRFVLGSVLLIYAIIALFYITATPLQTITLPDNLPQTGVSQKDSPGGAILVGIGPDEKEHFLYVLSIAEQGRLPMPLPRYRTSPTQIVTYEAQHPPLFYALAALVLKITRALPPAVVWYILRGLCAICGGFVIVLTARAMRVAFPNGSFFALAAAASVAFLPMFGYMTGTLSNEPLALAFGAWTWLQILRLLRGTNNPTLRETVLLALSVGLAALSRLTAVIWIPAALFALAYASNRVKQNPVRVVGIFLVGVAVLLLPWFLYTQFAFGTPFLRTFYRPLIAAGQPLDTLLLRYYALFYVATAWYPHWLVQFYLPGGTRGIAPLLVLCLDIALLLSLLQHASEERRTAAAGRDTTGRVIVWTAAGTLISILLAVIQQNLFVDWDVALSAGRYLIASLPATTMLFLLAVGAPTRKLGLSGQRGVAVAVAAVLLVADLYTLSLVRRFYTEHPTQDAVQPIQDSSPTPR